MKKLTRDEVHNLICKNLKKLRLSMDASQMTFGSFAGISNQQYSKYESGQSRIHATHLFMIAEECNVDINYFFK
jgi:transcriptional regulator with XRE-family HTH domain